MLSVLTFGLGFVLAGRVVAQTFTNLRSFTGGSDGAIPLGKLLLSSNTFYGTAFQGGAAGNGTVFKMNTDGTGFTNLHSFTTFQGAMTNSDGGQPYAGVLLSSNSLYGTTRSGGTNGTGAVFKVNTDGTNFSTLYTFTSAPSGTNSDGSSPQSELVLSSNAFYGTATLGGTAGKGTVFKMNTDGTGFTNLHSFTALTGILSTNSDGALPVGRLLWSSNMLYGTTYEGGTAGYGTVFRLNTDGSGFTNLHSFMGPDGATSYSALILSGNTLYGTATAGGDSDNGTIFKLNTDGSGFTNLHSFTALDVATQTNSDGAQPYAGLLLFGNTLYGTAKLGGNSGNGTVFKVNTDRTGFTTLHSFTALDVATQTTNSDGADPRAELVLLNNTLYGTASKGGSQGVGTVFSISLQPLLTITCSQTNVLLTWPTNASGFFLQSTTNLALTLLWSNVSTGPVVVNGQNTVTNPISGPQQFYRLKQ